MAHARFSFNIVLCSDAKENECGLIHHCCSREYFAKSQKNRFFKHPFLFGHRHFQKCCFDAGKGHGYSWGSSSSDSPNNE